MKPIPSTEHYVDGFVLAVPSANKDANRQVAKAVAAVFKKYGALAVVECWGDDVPEGEHTSFPMAVQCRPDETVVFSWTVWPSEAVRNAAMPVMMNDPDMPKDLPFDGKRVIFGGFDVLLAE